MTKVVCAVRELHDFGCAHLDIRLENICFRENGEAVLIDLDRSLEVIVPLRMLGGFCGSSTMYPEKMLGRLNAPVTLIDWRQVSIMAYYTMTSEKDLQEKFNGMH